MSGYDANLLAAAPAATKAELQEGYNIDLLNRHPPVAAAPYNHYNHSQEAHSQGAHTKETYGPSGTSPPPFWRSRKGAIVTGILAFLVLISIIIGVAVGVTRNKNTSGSKSSSTGPSFSSPTKPTMSTSSGTPGMSISSSTGPIFGQSTNPTVIVTSGSPLGPPLSSFISQVPPISATFMPRAMPSDRRQ